MNLLSGTFHNFEPCASTIVIGVLDEMAQKVVLRQNGGMYVSVEAISLIFVAAGVLITLGGGFIAGLAWLLRRLGELSDKMDQRFDKVDQRFDKVDQRFGKVDEQIRSVRSEINDVRKDLVDVRSELTEVKVAVARLEGPQPRLIYPR